MAHRVLTIEDDSSVAREIVGELERAGLSVDWIDNGREGLDRARSEGYDAIVLDLMSKTSDSLIFLSKLRAAGIQTPVLLLSEFGGVDEQIRSVRIRGDDYLVKPFELDEVVARVEVLLHHRQEGFEESATRLTVGELILDRHSKRLVRNGCDVTLSPIEYRIIEFMMRHAGIKIPRSMLFEAVWGYRFDPGAMPIDAYIRRLQKKIQPPETALMIQVQGRCYLWTNLSS